MTTGSRAARSVGQLAGHLGVTIRQERLRHGWGMREVALRSGLSIGGLHAIEHGRPASLGTYAALAATLGLEPSFELVDPRTRRRASRQADVVHAAMGELLARRLRDNGFDVAIDDPFQHYQFAGRADVLAWSIERRALLHVENKTRFPNIQDAFGSYNTKRRYLPAAVADRLGLRRGWDSVTNIILALWSTEVVREVRRHEASFTIVCPDRADRFAAWWVGKELPTTGISSSLLLFDPIQTGRSDRRQFVSMDVGLGVRSRYSGYVEAAAAISGR